MAVVKYPASAGSPITRPRPRIVSTSASGAIRASGGHFGSSDSRSSVLGSVTDYVSSLFRPPFDNDALLNSARKVASDFSQFQSAFPVAVDSVKDKLSQTKGFVSTDPLKNKLSQLTSSSSSSCLQGRLRARASAQSRWWSPRARA